MNDIEFQDIQEFIRNSLPKYKGELLPTTRIGEDLKIIGDDAAELLEGFSEKFEVDLESLDLSDYFPQEGSADMHFYLTSLSCQASSRLIKLRKFENFIWRFFSSKKQFKSMTLLDLYQAAKSKKWPAS